MKFVTDFNKHLGIKSFDPDAYMLILYLGGAAFYKYSGSTNMAFRKARGKRPTWLRMDLQANEGGFDRLKMHYLDGDVVRMEFSTYTPIAGSAGITGPLTVVENVKLEDLFDVFQQVTGLYMGGSRPADEPETVY